MLQNLKCDCHQKMVLKKFGSNLLLFIALSYCVMHTCVCQGFANIYPTVYNHDDRFFKYYSFREGRGLSYSSSIEQCRADDGELAEVGLNDRSTFGNYVPDNNQPSMMSGLIEGTWIDSVDPPPSSDGKKLFVLLDCQVFISQRLSSTYLLAYLFIRSNGATSYLPFVYSEHCSFCSFKYMRFTLTKAKSNMTFV